MELTSLGRAYLSTTSTARRKTLYGIFKSRRGTQWPALLADIEQSISSMHESGFCAASWQPEVVALACPITTAQTCYSLNVSVSTVESMEAVVADLMVPLLQLQAAILGELSRRVDE